MLLIAAPFPACCPIATLLPHCDLATVLPHCHLTAPQLTVSLLHHCNFAGLASPKASPYNIAVKKAFFITGYCTIATLLHHCHLTAPLPPYCTIATLMPLCHLAAPMPPYCPNVTLLPHCHLTAPSPSCCPLVTLSLEVVIFCCCCTQ